jgi:hypothetical protein
MRNATLTIENYGSAPKRLVVAVPWLLRFVVKPGESIVVTMADDHLNQLISQCVRRGLNYSLGSIENE